MKNRTRATILVAAISSLTLADAASAYYAPRLGRWLSRDPIGEEGGDNLLAYARNGVPKRWDARGTCEPDFGDFAGCYKGPGPGPKDCTPTIELATQIGPEEYETIGRMMIGILPGRGGLGIPFTTIELAQICVSIPVQDEISMGLFRGQFPKPEDGDGKPTGVQVCLWFGRCKSCRAQRTIIAQGSIRFYPFVFADTSSRWRNFWANVISPGAAVESVSFAASCDCDCVCRLRPTSVWFHDGRTAGL